MTYDIFSSTAPAMPATGNGTKFIDFILSNASKDMKEALVPMMMPALAAHLTEVEFKYSDNKFYEMCGQMGHLIGPSGIGKAQLTHLIEAVMRSFRQHDETEFQKLTEWQRQVKTKGANKEKPERPDVSFWFPPANMTNAAFLQNAIALEKQGGRTQYLNLPEVEQADTGNVSMRAFLKKTEKTPESVLSHSVLMPLWFRRRLRRAGALHACAITPPPVAAPQPNRPGR